MQNFNELITPDLRDFLVNLARKKFNFFSAETAEDLVQDVLFLAYRKIDYYEDGTNFRAWIIKLMYNTYINLYRKQQRSPLRSIVDFDKTEWKLSYDLDIELLFDTNILLENTPDSFRDVVTLALDGYSRKQIAKTLDIPIGTVLSRLHRANKANKEKFKKEVYGYESV